MKFLDQYRGYHARYGKYFNYGYGENEDCYNNGVVWKLKFGFELYRELKQFVGISITVAQYRIWISYNITRYNLTAE